MLINSPKTIALFLVKKTE